MDVAVASFPYAQWAGEVEDLLQSKGLQASIRELGPRAFEVLVPEEQGELAASELSELGYLTCGIRQDFP